MRIKLKISDPVIVAMGPERTVGWGTHQFPLVKQLPDGRLAVSYHISPDKVSSYGAESGWRISDDNGATWRDPTPDELPHIKGCFGVQLSSGKYLRNVQPKPHPMEEGFSEGYPNRETAHFTKRIYAVPADDLPEGLIAKTWEYALYDPETKEETRYYCDLDFPGMNILLTDSTILRPFPYGHLRKAPDGSLWHSHYSWGRNPYNMGSTIPYFSCYYFQSLDEGRSFKLKGWIQYSPDTREFPEAFTTEGFCEPDLCFMPDGSIITVIRTGNFTPSYVARSTDGGCTWSEPIKFDRCGVWPQLEHLDCGVTLATYGRPGLYVRATADPSGMTWEEPIALMAPQDPPKQVWKESCCYTGMQKLDDRTVLLVYSDFRVKNSDGTPCKCIMARTVHVE